jgi:hypothetical protein
MLCTVDTRQFWNLIEAARLRVADPADGEAIAALAAFQLSHFPREEIVAAEGVLKALMAASYRKSLWAAASLINGGCSDDGFEYFRGWLIAQGREVFERSVADPDSLAGLPVLGPAGPAQWGVWEQVLYFPLWAHKSATGQVLPSDAYSVRYPELEADPDFDLFDSPTEMARRLPRLTSLCWPDAADKDIGEPSSS